MPMLARSHESRAGVERLAQLDAHDAGEGDAPRRRGDLPAGWRRVSRSRPWWRWWWSCDCVLAGDETRGRMLLSVALGVGGELEEHLLQSGAFGSRELEEGDRCSVGDAPDRLGIGLDAKRSGWSAPARDRRWTDRRWPVPSASSSGCAGADVGPRGGEQVGLGARPRRSARSRSRPGRRRRPRSRAGGATRAGRWRHGRRSRGAGHASSGCRRGRARWRVRRGSGPRGHRGGRVRCRDAAACRGSSRRTRRAASLVGEADQVEHLVDPSARADPSCF